MDKKYEHLLLDEIIYLYINGDKKALIEVFNRLKFCDFDDKTIKLIIDTEINIIKARQLTFNIPFLNKFWWLKDKKYYENNKLLPLEKHKYYYLKDREIKNTLTLSELISIYDEAYYLTHIDNNVHENIYNEALEIAKYEDYRSWVICEIYSRLETLYRLSNDIINDDKTIKKIHRMHRFFDNESHIQHNFKWNRILDIKNKWRAYSDDYFDIIEKN